MIPENILKVMNSPLSASWLSCCDSSNRPYIARLAGVKLNNNHLLCFIPEKFAAHLSHLLVPGRVIAVMAVCPESFQSYQVKGAIRTIGPADQEQVERQNDALQQFASYMTFRNLSAGKLYQSYSDKKMIILAAGIDSIYDQTPMAGAGEKLAFDE